MTAGPLARLPALAIAALAYAAGATLALTPGARDASAAILLTLAAAATLAALRAMPYAAIAAWLLVGLAATSISLERRAADCRFGIEDGARITFRGTLTTLPASDGDATLRIEESDGGCVADVRARVRTRTREGAAPGDTPAPADLPAPGAELRGRGRWMASGLGSRDPQYAGTLFVDAFEQIAAADAGHHPLLAARGTAQARVRELFGEDAPVVEALVLARMEGIDPELRDRYARSGLAHLLSISGTHVGLIAGLLIAGAAAAGAAPGIGSAVAIAITWAYVLFLGAPAAAARAALMLTLFLAARLLQRPARASAILAASGVALIAWDPTVLAQVGFQLSFAGMIGLIGFAPPIGRTLPARWPHWLRDGVAGGLGATVATAPVCALHFQQIAPVGVVANLVAVPAMAVAVPAIGVCLALSTFWMAGAHFLAGGTRVLVAILDRTAEIAAALPYGHAHVNADLAVALTLAVAAAAAAARGLTAPATPGRGVRPWARRTAAAGVAVAILIAWPAAAARGGSGALEIHLIDVGQGDALAVRTPNGAWLLFDAGPRTGGWDAGARRVAPYLLRQGVRRLEAIVLTHAHADHIGGAHAVAERIPTMRVVDAARAFGADMHTELMRAARHDDVVWLAGIEGATMTIDDVRLTVLHPTPETEHEDINELSVVVLLGYADFTMLLTGDAGLPSEQAIVERARRTGSTATLDVDVLKVGHHGSRSATGAAFLDATTPGIALIGVGKGNRYGHPHATVLERLEGAGVRVYRTDLDGDVVLRVRRNLPVEVTTSR